MKLKLNQRGFILAEFVMALPLLILLLYALGTLTLNSWKIARKQVADYVLETEAQEIIDRITQDARAAYSVEIKKSTGLNSNLENIFFKCHALDNIWEGDTFKINDEKYYQYRKVDEEKFKLTEDEEFKPYNRQYRKEILEPRIYAIHTAPSGLYHVYFKRQDDNNFSSPIIGENSFGNTYVTQMKFSKEFLSKKILHITFEMQSVNHEQKVKFTTAVYMPACEEIIYCGEKIL